MINGVRKCWELFGLKSLPGNLSGTVTALQLQPATLRRRTLFLQILPSRTYMLDCESVHATWTVNLGAEILKATRKSPPPGIHQQTDWFWCLPRGSIVVPFWGSYFESYKRIPKRNYYGPKGSTCSDRRFGDQGAQGLCPGGGRVFGDSRFEEGFKVPIVSILVPFFGLTKYIIRIL